MQCNQCGYILPSGAAICPHCSNPVPPNTGATLANALIPAPRPLEPTQLASGTPRPLEPTQLASGTPRPLEPTQLASQAGDRTFRAPPPPPTTGGQMPLGQSVPGWSPVPGFAPAQPQQKSGCGIATIIVLVILFIVVCAGAILGGGIWYIQKRNATSIATTDHATFAADDATATADVATADVAKATAHAATQTVQLTPTPYPPYTESNPPSGAQFSGTAQQIITNAQMASQINSRYQATELQSVFSLGQNVYLTYHWTNVGSSGYIGTTWYFDGQRVGEGRSDYISTNYSDYNGYYAYRFLEEGQGAVEVYWCSRADCSDRQLAWVRPFSVAA